VGLGVDGEILLDLVVVAVGSDELARGPLGQQFTDPRGGVGSVAGDAVVRKEDTAVALAGDRNRLAGLL
jgi:hypothetical protein